MWRTVDPDGRIVVLSDDAWAHILDGHPQLARRRSEVLTAVAMPEERMYGRFAHEEWFYRLSRAGSPWLKVVVHYDAKDGQIVTAFPRRWIP